MNAPDAHALSLARRFGSGAVMRRIEDPALVQGQGRFTDDVQPAGQLHLRFVRSPQAHGLLRSVDAEAARALPGVVAVFTGADLVAAGVQPLAPAAGFKQPDGTPMQPPTKRALAFEHVRYVGEPVAAVVARSREAARAAADAVLLDIEALPAVVDTLPALAAGAPQVCAGAPGNVLAAARHGDAAAVQAAFEGAAHRVVLELVNQRLAPVTLEPRAVLAQVEGEGAQQRLVVRLSSQMPSAVRGAIAACLPGRTVDNTRVLVGDVGGGFGMKTGVYPEDIAVAYAAQALQQPVKWQAERLEDFLSAVHGRDLVTLAEMALDAQGKALAIRTRSYANVGAYPTGAGVGIQLLVGPWVTTSIYDIPLVDLHISAVLTHTAPTGAYRGAGRPEAIYITERLFDAAARQLQLCPAELRRRNLVRPEQMPYKNAMGQTYDSGRFESILDQALVLADWPGFDARCAASQAAGKLRGRGLASFLEWTGGNALEEKVQVRVAADGFVELVSATMPMGQGIATSYTQLAVDVFGLPPERIRIVQGDTDRSNGFGSAGSRSLFTGGAALRVAAQQTVAQAQDLAAQALEAPATDIEYHEGRFTVAGTDLGIGLFELAARQPGAAILAEGGAKASAPSWPNGCHIAEVEVDPDTGEVTVVAYASVNDIGRIVSPQIVQGQIEGGAVQGIGQALCERVAYDADSGQLLSASFMDYALPHADGFRAFKTAFDERIPCLTNSLGSKGVGELGTIGATPAVVNAVVDAVCRAGQPAAAHTLQMPLTSERVWCALRGSVAAPLFTAA
jgi:carbon-monoxide dehydrogenase large subunit